METLTELEKFHQLVLFKIMDRVPNKTKWIAVDKNARITAFNIKPQIILENDEWSFRYDDGVGVELWWDYITMDENTYIKVVIPPTIEWTDCIWEFPHDV